MTYFEDTHVVLQANGWYFWDESGVIPYGPFPSKAKAKEEFNKYVEYLDKYSENHEL